MREGILRNHRWAWVGLAGIMLLAIWMRLDFLMSVFHLITHDTKYYDIMVRQLLENGVCAYKSTAPNARVTPGFPLIMAAVYRIVDYRVRDPFPYLRYLNVLLSLATLLLVFLIARKLVGDLAACLAALMAAIYPAFIWANGAVLTEVPAAFFLMLYLYVQLLAWESNRLFHALLAGALLGLTALVRPEFMPLCVPLYLFYWLSTRDHRFWKPLLVALVGLSIVMSPWWIRNIVTLNQFVLSATQTNPFTAGTYPDKNYTNDMVDPTGKTPKQLAMERLKVGFTEHTWTFVRWYTIGKLYYVYSNMFVGSGHTPHYKPIPYGGVFHIGIMMTSLLGMLLSLRHWRQPLNSLAVVIVFMSALRLLFVPEYRYNFTVMTLFIIFSAAFGAALLQWIYTRYVK